MTYSLYEATIVTAKGALTSLQQIMAQAEKHPNSAVLPTARLADDMDDLSFQVSSSEATIDEV